jgi:antitoxin MazE
VIAVKGENIMPHLIKIGNSQGVRIPKPLLQQAKLENVELEFVLVEEGLLVAPVRKKPRQDWAERITQALAAHGDEGVDAEWLAAPLVDDEDWEW